MALASMELAGRSVPLCIVGELNETALRDPASLRATLVPGVARVLLPWPVFLFVPLPRVELEATLAVAPAFGPWPTAANHCRSVRKSI